MIDIKSLRTVQKNLSRYIFSKGFLSWDGIRKACKRIILALPEGDQKYFKDRLYPEFDIFLPLLRNGSVEVCRTNTRTALLFCMNPHTALKDENGNEYARGKDYFSLYRTREYLQENNNIYKDDLSFIPAFDSLLFLQSYPSIAQQICSFSEQQIQASSFRLEQNLRNYQYTQKQPGDLKIGIYKLNDYAWAAPYLFDNDKRFRKIPYYAENPDSMNLARLYVRTHNEIFTKPIFEYNKVTLELTCNRYSELPILLTRALLLFEPSQLILEDFCTSHPSIPFKNVSMDAIKELKRIFSDRAITIR